jgi:hypothetical protein
VRTKIWLTVDRYGVRRINKKKHPKMFQDERVIALIINIPDSVFMPCALPVEISIPENMVEIPQKIAEVTQP